MGAVEMSGLDTSTMLTGLTKAQKVATKNGQSLRQYVMAPEICSSRGLAVYSMTQQRITTYHHTKSEAIVMEYSTVYVGMDVHKDTFSVCCYTYEDDKCKFKRSFSSDYKNILQYIASMHKQYGEKVDFVTGYEAGCLGYSLYYHGSYNHG